MLKSSVLEILRTFDEEELMKFEDFLKSPYHNKIANVIKLLSVIKKYYPEFNNKELDKKFVWKKLFPEKEYNYGTMKNLIYELTKLAMKFIVLEDFERDILEKDNILINCLNERKITKLFNVKMSEIERRYSKDSFNAEYFFVNDIYSSMSKMLWIKIYHYRANNINAESENDITAGSAMFIYSFLIYLFKYYNNVMIDSLDKNFSMDKNILAVFLKEISPEIIDKLLTIVKDYSDRDFRVMSVFWNMSKSYRTNSSLKDYLEFKKSLYNNIDIFSRWDARDLFHAMGNSLNNIDPSSIDIDKELFDISNTMLSTNIIFTRDPHSHELGGTLTTSDFNLYNWRAFNAGDYDAIAKFTSMYINKIPQDSMEYCKNISRAYLLFGEKKFNEVLEVISISEHPNFVTKVRMKHFKAKCLYELNEFENFKSEYKSIYHFLKNNKSLSLKIKTDTKNLFDKINRMFSLKEKFNSFEYDKLRNEISKSSFSNTTWLNKKIKEFETNSKSKSRGINMGV